MPLTRRRVRSYHSAAAAVTYYASDAFTDTTNTVITSHTPVAVGSAPAGTAWVGPNGPTPEVQIQGNRVTKVGSAAGGNHLTLNAGTTPSDQSVTADLAMLTNIDQQFTAICARRTTGGVGCYYLEYVSNTATPSTSFFALYRFTDAFALTQIGSNYTFAFPTPGTVVPVEIRCVAGAISANINGVANAISGTDGSPLTGTLGGLKFQQGAGGSSTLTTGVHVDNLVVRSPS